MHFIQFESCLSFTIIQNKRSTDDVTIDDADASVSVRMSHLMSSFPKRLFTPRLFASSQYKAYPRT